MRVPLPILALLLAVAGLQLASSGPAWAYSTAPGKDGGLSPPKPLNFGITTRPNLRDRYRRSCPRGMAGVWPYCRWITQPRIPDCPKGFVGRGHRCIKIHKPKCPQGMAGQWPDCQRPALPEPRRCPDGTSGRWPRCKSVESPPPPRRGFAATTPVVPPADPPQDQRPDEILLLLDQTQAGDIPFAIARHYRLTRLQAESNRLLRATIQRYRIPDQRSPAQVLAAMRGDRRIQSAQANYLYRLQSGSLADQQYAPAKIRLAQAQGLALGRQIPVVVIDSAIDAGHPELAGAVAQSFDAADDRPGPADAHGTAVAGIIAARDRMLGVAPASRLLAARAFFHEGGEALTTSFILLRAVDWALGSKARIFNLSFTGPKDPVVERLMAAAQKEGAILVAAAGNGGPQAPPAYPAAYPGVIAVTALDQADRLYAKANRGGYLTLAAPGVDILAPAPGNGYGFQSGTSFAAAHVSGLVALMLERNPALTAAQVRALLTGSATDLGPPGKDEQFGAGRVDALRPVQAGAPGEAP
ncbi:MAG: hypothetical protein A2514_07765 [Gammaproteobacteria bacterium RIFOXYD12_FULL_61_37]|nr:MAG: hypothetical protein A2514_07765 [Gammaproteobacteria bacterium RIFOXYD12_FULL_61_37]